MRVTATAQRSGGWWAIEIPDVAGGLHTQTKRLDHVAEVAAGAVADVLNIPADEVEVDVVPSVNHDVDDLVAAAREAAAAAADAQATASAKMREAVARLRTPGPDKVSVRDAAVMLGISHQRIDQLAP